MKILATSSLSSILIYGSFGLLHLFNTHATTLFRVPRYWANKSKPLWLKKAFHVLTNVTSLSSGTRLWNKQVRHSFAPLLDLDFTRESFPRSALHLDLSVKEILIGSTALKINLKVSNFLYHLGIIQTQTFFLHLRSRKMYYLWFLLKNIF